MASNVQYSKPPVTEAIIDLRIHPLDSDGLSVLRALGQEQAERYPHEEDVFESVGKMRLRPQDDLASLDRKPTGWRYQNAEKTQVFQARVNGFTFSRLVPYQSWAQFRDEAKRLWQLYRAAIKPNSISRLAVRYINRIDVPFPAIDLKEYFRTSPEIAPELPQTMEGYFFQLQLPFSEVQARCLLNQTIVPPPRKGITSVVLDIDLFRTEDIPQEENGIWAVFEQLHEQKNLIFEHCITDSTRSLFHDDYSDSSTAASNV